MALQSGELLAGKYRIERLLGEGGMGAVYVATNLVIEREVALKVMNERFASMPEAVERFQREAVAASRVSHPGIVQVFDAGSHDGKPWIAMELLEGESLGQRLARGPFGLDDVLRVARGVLSALAEVHDAGIIHRDLKPDNIFLATVHGGGDWTPKILDFGIAKETANADHGKLTITGTLVGSACYLSPEQALGRTDIDARADVYAMGVVLYECLAGRRPFDAATISQLVAKMFTEAPPPLAHVAPDVPVAMAEVVDLCLAHDRERRFLTARSVLGAIESAIASTAVRARSVSTAAPARPASSAAYAATCAVDSDRWASPSMPAPPRSSFAVEPKRRTELGVAALAAVAVFVLGAIGATALAFVAVRSGGRNDLDAPLPPAAPPTVAAREPAPLAHAAPDAALPAGVSADEGDDATARTASEDGALRADARRGADPLDDQAARSRHRAAHPTSPRSRPRLRPASSRPPSSAAPPAPAPPRLAAGLSAQQIDSALQVRADYLGRRCYQRRLRRVPGLRGVVVISWTVRPDGRADDVQVAGNTTGDEWLGRCTRNVVRGTRFPVALDGLSTFARHPFHFGAP